MENRWLGAFADFLFPQNIHCLICGRQILPGESYSICPKCRKNLRFLSEDDCCNRCGRPISNNVSDAWCSECAGQSLHFEKAVSCLAYDDFSRRLIFMLKYGKKVYAAFHMAEMIRDRLHDSDMEAFDLIVPVPLHASRERERGFNQAFLLAKALGKMREEPVCKAAIYMKRPTIDQTRLGRQGRFKNLRGSFNTGDGINLKGKRILLIDDVLTTGATADDCARALKEAGAEAVVVATLACS